MAIQDRVTPEVVTASIGLRMGDLVAAAPVPTMLVDYRRVMDRFDDLRRAGVADLKKHLAEHPTDIKTLLNLLDATVTNQSWYQMYGSVRAESRPPISNYVVLDGEQPKVIQSLVVQLDAAWNGLPSVVCEHPAPAGHDDMLWVRSSWRVLITEKGPDYSCVIISDVDISALKAAEEVLREALLAKDRFLAAVSHEIRTPLTPIYGLAAELEHTWRSLPTQEVTEMLTLVREQAEELSGIVDNLLVATRAAIGAVAVHASSHALGEAIRSIGALQPTVLEIDPQVKVMMDIGRTRQIIRNLLTNAHRYGGDAIHLESRTLDDCVEVAVRDNGPGIDETLLDHLFEAYARSSSVSGLPDSVGLGLHVSKTLANLMDGDLEYRRTGGWTEFVLTLKRPR